MLETLGPANVVAAVERTVASASVHALVSEISSGAGRLSEIVGALKSYSYIDQSSAQREVDVREGLDTTLVILRSKLRDGITVQREYAQDLPRIPGYAGELNQVWTILIDNAIDAMGGRGTITLRARHEGAWVVVTVEDSGPGIPAAIQPRIFDPFFTTKAPGRGTGLGLNISHTIVVQRHNGRLTVASEPGCTRFDAWLPVQRKERK